MMRLNDKGTMRKRDPFKGHLGQFYVQTSEKYKKTDDPDSQTINIKKTKTAFCTSHFSYPALYVYITFPRVPTLKRN